MSKKQAICLVLILVVGWGSAFAIAYGTNRRGLAVGLFMATLAVFAYWPIREKRGDDE